MEIQPIVNASKAWALNQRSDFIAGMATATLTLPQAVAFAVLAGLPVETALWASIVPTIIAGFIGARVEMLTGPVSMLALITGTTLSALFIPLSPDAISAAIFMALGVGVMQIIASFTGAVRLLEWMPSAAVKGIMGAVGFNIIASQIPVALGVLHSPMTPRWEQGWAMITTGHWLVPAAGVCFATIALIALCAHAPWNWIRKGRFAIGMLVSSYGAAALGLNVLKIGNLSLSQPLHSLAMTPNVEMIWPMLIGPIFTMAALALTQSALIAKSMPGRGRCAISLKHEALAQGAANLSAALVGGLPVAVSLNRSIAHEKAGAKTWWSLIWVGLGVLLIMATLSGLLADIAVPAAAGMLAVVAVSLVDLDRDAPWAERAEVLAFIAIGFLIGMAWAVIVAIFWGIFSHAQATKKAGVSF